MSESHAYNMDCLAAMREMPDKAFDLACIDPPYGVNLFLNNQPTRLNKYGSMQTANDLKPSKEFFAELFRVSKNQIIWGYNHDKQEERFAKHTAQMSLFIDEIKP